MWLCNTVQKEFRFGWSNLIKWRYKLKMINNSVLFILISIVLIFLQLWIWIMSKNILLLFNYSIKFQVWPWGFSLYCCRSLPAGSFLVPSTVGPVLLSHDLASHCLAMDVSAVLFWLHDSSFQASCHTTITVLITCLWIYVITNLVSCIRLSSNKM